MFFLWEMILGEGTHFISAGNFSDARGSEPWMQSAFPYSLKRVGKLQRSHYQWQRLHNIVQVVRELLTKTIAIIVRNSGCTQISIFQSFVPRQSQKTAQSLNRSLKNKTLCYESFSCTHVLQDVQPSST